MHAWLFATAFVLYTGDYVIAGVLPELTNDLGVTEGQTGQLVAVSSLTVALAAPIATVVLAHASRRRLFGFALLVFIFTKSAAAVAPSFAVLMILRVVAAMALSPGKRWHSTPPGPTSASLWEPRSAVLPYPGSG